MLFLLQFVPTTPKIVNEEVVNQSKVTGNRIVDVLHMFSQFQKLNKHCESFGCSLNNMQIIKESRNGLHSKFFFECNMCNGTFSINNVKEDGLTLNEKAVSGIMSIGGRFYNCFQKTISTIFTKTINTSYTN